MAKGILAATIINFNNLPNSYLTAAVTPNEVKKQVTGHIKTTKDEIMTYVVNDYKICTRTKGNRISYCINNDTYSKGEFEHIADSLVATNIVIKNLTTGDI
jgi:hypothetical protein